MKAYIYRKIAIQIILGRIQRKNSVFPIYKKEVYIYIEIHINSGGGTKRKRMSLISYIQARYKNLLSGQNIRRKGVFNTIYIRKQSEEKLYK